MKKIIFIVIVCIMIGVAGGYGTGYLRYEPQIKSYEIQVANLTTEVSSLEQTVANREQTISIQEACISTQTAQISTLESEKSSLQSEVSSLKQTVSSQEVLISTQTAQISSLESVKSNLEQTVSVQKITISILDSEKSRLQNEKTQMLTQYGSLRSKIMARTGLTQQDRQSYITPNDATVSATVQGITSGYNGDMSKFWLDYKKMYTWVVDNIDYSYDSYLPVLPASISDAITWREDFWRTPAETLKDKTGDCEDMALLLISMLESYNKIDYAVWTVSIVSKVPEPKRHMAVAFPVAGGKLTILDPAGNYYTGIQSGYLRSESIASAVNSWLSHWSKEMPGAFIDGVMSENVDRQFSSSDEFIAWASQQ